MNSVTETSASQQGWRAISASVPGRKHLREGVPCQDACEASTTPRPYVVVCDGKGSASLSQLGSHAAAISIGKQVAAARELFRICLDEPDEQSAQQAFQFLADLVYNAAATEQQRLAQERNANTSDFEHTLIFAAVGKCRVLFLHVGDGALVAERNRETCLLSAPERDEFANVTMFVTADGKRRGLRSGLVSAQGIGALAALSDGTADKMLEATTQKPALGFATIWEKLRAARFSQRDLVRFLTESFWEPAVQDDRSLALLANACVLGETPERRGAGELPVPSPEPGETTPVFPVRETAQTVQSVLPDGTLSHRHGLTGWCAVLIGSLLVIDLLAVLFLGRIALESKKAVPNHRGNNLGQTLVLTNAPPPVIHEHPAASTNPVPSQTEPPTTNAPSTENPAAVHSQ